MPDYTQAGGTPDFYAQMLQAARSGLVRMPDGSYQPAPQFGTSTSVDDLYRGIIPGGATASASDPSGPGGDWGALTGMVDDPSYSGLPDPSTYGQPPASVAQTRAEQLRPKPLNVAGNAGAGTAVAAIDDLVGIPQASGTINGGKDQSRLDTPLLAFNGEGANVPLPRIRPDPAAGVPMPRPRPDLPGGNPISISVPYSAPDEGGTDYTVRRGDTLSAISKRSGMSVAQLAAVNGIANPNRIFPGQKISFGSIGRQGSGGAPSPMPAPRFSRSTLAALSAPAMSAADPWQGLRVNEAPSVPGLIAASPTAARSPSQSNNGGGTIATNPTKYGATQADRNASAAARASLLAQFGG